MKKRYYLSMLSLYLLIVVFDSIYFFFHKSFKVFLMMAIVHFVLYGLINFLGTYLLYKPIDRLFTQGGGDTKQAKERISHLTWYSTSWIFIIGFSFIAFGQLSLFFNSSMYGDLETFSMDKMPFIYMVSIIPASLFLYAIFPAFITYFLINDFNLDLKAKVFLKFQIMYSPGKKRIGLTLLFVFFILVFIPALLVILELVVMLSLGDKYAQFSSVNPLETVMVDRFLVLVGMITAVILLKRSFTKPIYSLLKEINRVRDGDYSAQAAITTEDEIGLLTNEFNEMVRELENSYKMLEESNRTLEKKVEERTLEIKQKNSELEETLDTLKQMQNQVIIREKMASLGQLMAGLTHEFNTPISVIRSMKNTKSKAVTKLQTALDNIDPDSMRNNQEIRKVMEGISKADQLIDQATDRLHEIIKNLMNFVRLDEAEMKMADIHEGLDSTLGLIKHDLLTNIEVIRKYGEIPPFICHPRELNQVFLNILMNASHAIEGKGRITITTKLENNMVHVAIRDTGKGIKTDDLTSIFDPRFTTKSSSVRASLGLSICYQVIKEHHGKINVESQPGKGSVFTVMLPLEFKNANNCGG